MRRGLLIILLVACLGILAPYTGVNFYTTNTSKTTSEEITEMDLDGLPKDKVTVKFLQSKPEANLVYPNSKVISPFGSDEISILEGVSAGFIGAILQSNDSEEQIYSWYRNKLLESGWQEAQYGRAMEQKSLQGYQRGKREKSYVAMHEPDTFSKGKTFEYRYAIGPYEK